MRPGELVLARLDKGATLVRYLGEASSRVELALGRNKQAKLPPDRILMATGIVGLEETEVEAFRRECEDVSSGIDLSEVWEVVTGEDAYWSLHDLADLRWGSAPAVTQLVALALHLDRGQDFFLRDKQGYRPRSAEEVTEIRARRRREAERAEAASSLMSSLLSGRAPEPLSRAQAALLDHLRGYAIHGDDSDRSSAAKRLLETALGPTRDLQRQCFDLLVGAGVFSPDEHLELLRAGLEVEFTDQALDEAASVRGTASHEDPRRKDLTGLAAVTIDDADTRDRDDALSLELSEAGGSGFRIGVHIADAGALVPLGGPIDLEAGRRMATLYLPDRTILMLPPDVSQESGSLESGVTRAAISVLIRLEPSGEVVGWEVVPSVVRSRASLTYEDADRAIAEGSSPWHGMLGGLHKAALALRGRRESAGAVVFDRAEMGVKVRPTGEVEVKVVRASTPARETVAEMMILCNSLLADYARREGIPAVFRSQMAPDLSDLPRNLRKGNTAGSNALWRYLVIKRMTAAEISTVPSAHGGLGVQAYLQATSPLRRYPDLVMQRQISRFLSDGEAAYSEEAIASVAHRAETQLRELTHLEDDRKRYWFLKYLQQARLDASGPGGSSDLFEAIVLENEFRRAALIELAEFPFRLRAPVPRALDPGEVITLRLLEVDLWRRVGHFVHVEAAR